MQRPAGYLLASCLAMLTFSACAPFGKLPGRSYQTVISAPQRDAKKAAEATARAEKLFERGRPEKARAALEEALVADVTYGPAHNNLGKYHYDKGEYYLASWEFEYAAHLMPEIPEPYNNLGLVFEAVERLDQAVEYYELAYEMEPQNPQLIGNLARARMKRDDNDPEASRLLRDLVLFDTRPRWTTWARGRLGRYDLPSGAPAPAAAETLPAPEDASLLPESTSPEHMLPDSPNSDSGALLPVPQPVSGEQTSDPDVGAHDEKGPLFGLPVPDLSDFLRK